MSVKIIDNTATVNLQNDLQASLFLRFFLDDVEKNSDPLTPKKEGQLRRGTVKSVLGMKATIIWNKEYAAAQEAGTTQGHPITHYTTPGTGKAYAKRGVEKAMKNSQSTMRKARLVI